MSSWVFRAAFMTSRAARLSRQKGDAAVFENSHHEEKSIGKDGDDKS
jgi:hypothetical protein